ncbi:MAG: hypothetical protein CMF74_09980 [Maricaulis sp.]|jgi:hypothetical protein|nr:hypothetical protein [Maricaulis sp.]
MKKVPITSEIRAQLRQLRQKSGLGPTAFLAQADDPPPGLSVNMIYGWLNGHRKSAERAHLDYVLDRWSQASKRVLLSVKAVALLISERERTGVGAQLLLRHAQGAPADLKGGMVDRWFTGTTKSAMEHHLEFVLAAYAALPDKPPTRARVRAQRIPLDKARIEQLEHLRQSTGIGPQALFTGAGDAPAGLNSNAVYAWLDGRMTHIRADHYDYVVERWRSIPARLELTPARRARLVEESRRTKVGWTAILRHIGLSPQQLTPVDLSQWANGKIASVRSDLWKQVLEAYAALPDAAPKPKTAQRPYQGGRSTGERRVFTEQDRATLETERERTGVSQAELLRRVKAGQPDDLTAGKISGWINNPPTTVPVRLIEWTLGAWRSLPDKAL